ncbi:MAG: MGMT family protein [Candidatus Aureabacteria bacterium]|nr:MGMT family protein [Candidatus Auribacterota bacterium]
MVNLQVTLNRKRFYSPLETDYGRFIACHDGEKVYGLAFPSNKTPAKELTVCALSRRLEKSLNNYLRKGEPLPDYKTHIFVTEFAAKVINAVRSVPFGKTRTYSSIAAKIGRPGSQRAVGSVCRKNPVPIIVPCHRIIPERGGIGNYSSGRKWKKMLLAIEKNRGRDIKKY